jgi:hypothetical protein
MDFIADPDHIQFIIPKMVEFLNTLNVEGSRVEGESRDGIVSAPGAPRGGTMLD